MWSQFNFYLDWTILTCSLLLRPQCCCAHMLFRAKKCDEVKLWRRIKHTAYLNKFFSFSPRAEWQLNRFSTHAWSMVKVGLSHTWNFCHDSYDPDCSEVLFSFYMPLSVFQPVLVAIWESQRSGLSNFRSVHLICSVFHFIRKICYI